MARVSSYSMSLLAAVTVESLMFDTHCNAWKQTEAVLRAEEIRKEDGRDDESTGSEMKRERDFKKGELSRERGEGDERGERGGSERGRREEREREREEEKKELKSGGRGGEGGMWFLVGLTARPRNFKKLLLESTCTNILTEC